MVSDFAGIRTANVAVICSGLCNCTATVFDLVECGGPDLLDPQDVHDRVEQHQLRNDLLARASEDERARDRDKTCNEPERARERHQAFRESH